MCDEKGRIKKWLLVGRVAWCGVVAHPVVCDGGKAWFVQVAVVSKLMPETHDADIHLDEDVTNVRNFSADIMKELRSVRK